MYRLAAIGLAGIFSAVVSAQMLMAVAHLRPDDQPRPAQAVAAVAEAPMPEAAAAAGGSDAELTKSADGHYWADAQVNGQSVHVLVDTGSTTVALTPDDARRLGLDPDDLNYAYQVSTASGMARAAQVHLASVSVAGAEVDNVDALVVEKGLPTSLLGMSYLGRLSRFEATPSTLILQP
jgi:aspartyl protease family protein